MGEQVPFIAEDKNSPPCILEFSEVTDNQSNQDKPFFFTVINGLNCFSFYIKLSGE